jgi:hypothetical protein
MSAIAVQLVRPSDKEMLITAAMQGDGSARNFLCILGLTVREVRERTGGVPCCVCDRIVGRRAVQTATHCLAWVEGGKSVTRSIACQRCADGLSDEDLRRRAADDLNSRMNRQFAASRGSTFSLTAGTA